MDDLTDWPLVLRYLAGECTPAEELRVATWLGADPARRAYVESLRDIQHRFGQRALQFDLDSARSRLQERLAAQSATESPPTRRSALSAAWGGARGRTALHQRMAVLAAALVVALGLGFGIGRLPRHAGVLRSGREYRTAVGQRLSVTLSDGTQFTLAPASVLHVAANYAAGHRDVQLEGEAFFSVVHDSRRPFTVHARNATAVDVGTAFDVRAYASDADVRVAVAEGEVDVRAARAARMPPVRAGDIAVITDTSVAITHDADVATVTGWTQGRLVFRDAPLADVVAELSRWSGAEIRVPDAELARRHLSAAYAGEPIADVLGTLGPVVGARVDSSRGVYTLTPITPLPMLPRSSVR